MIFNVNEGDEYAFGNIKIDTELKKLDSDGILKLIQVKEGDLYIKQNIKDSVKSIKDTFGVGTLIAVPSSFPFNSGRTKLKAFAAPVDVGIIDIAAPLALLKSLCV